MVDSSRYIALRLQQEKQNEDQQLAREALQQRNQQFWVEQGMSAAKSLGGLAASSMAQSKQDGIANSLMNQNDPIPRAQAVGENAPAIQSAADTKAAGMPGFHTGGADELKFSLAMDTNKSRHMAAQLAGMRENRMAQAQDDFYNHQKTQDAIAAAKATDQKTKDSVTASAAYFKNMDVMRDRLNDAQAKGDFREYNQTAINMQALHAGNVSAGLKLPDLQIPDFVGPSPQNEGAFSSAMDNWNNARGAAMQKDGWKSGGQMGIPFIRDSVPSNGERYMAASEELNKQKAAFVKRPVDKFQPQADPVAAPSSQGNGSMPAGQIIRNKATGQMMKWNGQAWENI